MQFDLVIVSRGEKFLEPAQEKSNFKGGGAHTLGAQGADGRRRAQTARAGPEPPKSGGGGATLLRRRVPACAGTCQRGPARDIAQAPARRAPKKNVSSLSEGSKNIVKT